MKIFFDTEFTGLHQNTTPISIGCVSESGDTFYAEFIDYDRGQVDAWIQEYVIDRLELTKMSMYVAPDVFNGPGFAGDRIFIAEKLRSWLQSQSNKDAVFGDMRNIYPDRHPKTLEMWSDTLAYDWILFCELFGGALRLPECVYYIPFDLATLFKAKGIEPDISREGYAGMGDGGKHNALWDAHVIKACYEKVMRK